MTPLAPPLVVRLLLTAACAGALLTAAGCVGTAPIGPAPTTGVVLPPPAEPAPAPRPAPVPVRPPLLPDAGALPPAPMDYPKTLAAAGASAPVLSLAKSAQQSRAAGQGDAAIGQWQRALRIEPKNAFLWYELAATQLQLKRGDQAESAAQKSISLARGNLWLEAQGWRLLASARRLLADAAGADAALARANRLSAGFAAATTP